MQEFNIVTTFAEKHKWGHDMVTSCEKYLPSNCTISVYLDQELPEDRERVKYFKLPEERIRKFKEWFMPIKNSKIPPNVECNSDVYNKNLYYFWDADRFCYKVYAMNEAIRSQQNRYMVWVDADVLFESSPSNEWMKSLINEGTYTSFLHRKTRHAETGFVIFDKEHSYNNEWWDTVMDLYDNGKITQIESGWTDSHVHDYMISLSTKIGVKHTRLSENAASRAWNESPLIKHCRHFKGLQANNEHGSNK